jgi:hypothetical protein
VHLLDFRRQLVPLGEELKFLRLEYGLLRRDPSHVLAT